MEMKIIEILETVAVTVSGFIIKKYVFLEPDMEKEKQYPYYLISALIIGTVYFLLGKDFAAVTAMFLIGLNVCLGRKKRKFRGMLLMIPFPGIVNGLWVPALVVPPYLLSMSGKETGLYQMTVYGVTALLTGMIYVKGKAWRKQVLESMGCRQLRRSEKYLLWIVGILMLFFAYEVAAFTGTDRSDVLWTDVG